MMMVIVMKSLEKKDIGMSAVDLETLLLEDDNDNDNSNKINNSHSNLDLLGQKYDKISTSDSATNNMISLLNTLQGVNISSNSNNNSYSNKNDEVKEIQREIMYDNDSYFSEHEHLVLENDIDSSPLSIEWDPQASTKQKLTALNAAERREQRHLMVGSKEIVSALHLRHSKDGGGSLESTYNNVKCVELETLSSQLMRNASYKQHGPGIATVVCAHSKFIAIGTSKGLILLFDYNQEIRQVIGSTVAHNNRCIAPVTCISISSNGTALVCGYDSGEVALWDIAKGSILKRVTELHSTKIIRINFVRNISDGLPNVSASSGSEYNVISADDKGVVRTIHFTKMLWSSYMVDSECLLDSSSGAILDMVPLVPLFDVIEAETEAFLSRNANSSNNATSAQKFQSSILADLSSASKETSNVFIGSPNNNQQFVAFNTVLRTYIVQVQPIVRIVQKWGGSRGCF